MYRKLAQSLVTIIIVLTCLDLQSKAGLLPDFKRANAIAYLPDLNSRKAQFLLKTSGKNALDTFQTIYNNAPTQRATTPFVPKIIHQIWLGSEFPVKYHHYQALLKQLHPDWEYILWRDADVEKFGLSNKKAYNEAQNYGEKSDIARYEILDRLGGIYFDVDVECLKSFDFLIDRYDFFAALEPLPRNTMTCLSLANAIIGCRPGHPVIKECIKQIKNPPIFTNGWHPILKTVVKTGPVLLTRAAYMLRSEILHKGIILPSECFTPANAKNVNKNVSYRFCIHHWSHSWMKKLSLGNEEKSSESLS